MRKIIYEIYWRSKWWILRILRPIARIFRVPGDLWAAFRLKLFLKKDTEPGAVGLVVDSLGKGGLEQVVMNLYKGYRQHGVPAYIIVVSEHISYYIEQIEDNPEHYRILYYRAKNLMNYCRKRHIKTLHYHFSTFKMPLAKWAGLQTMYTIHNTYVWFGRRAWLKTKLNLKFCDKIIAVSDFVKEYFEKKTGITGVVTIPNGIEVSRFENEEKLTPDRTMRKKYGLKKSDYVFAVVGSYTEQKYQLFAVGAMEEIQKTPQAGKIKLLLCGPALDKRLFKTIRRRARKSQARDNIIVAGAIDSGEMGEFMRSVPDALLLPSLYEGGVPPLTVIEGLICGLPVIMTDLGISESEFAKYITVVDRARQDLTTIKYEDMRRTILNQKLPQRKQLAETMLTVSQGAKPPKLSQKLIKSLSVETMVQKYLDLMAENSPSRKSAQ